MKYELTPEDENCLKYYKLYENGKPGFEPDCPNIKFDIIPEKGGWKIMKNNWKTEQDGRTQTRVIKKILG